MIRINLLPWRDALRKQKQSEFYVGIGISAISAIVVVLGSLYFLNGEIQAQQDMRAKVEAKTKELRLVTKKIRDIKKKKTVIDDKIMAIQKLQNSRQKIVHFMDEVGKVIPDSVHLTEIKQTEGQVSIKGKTQSNARISELMRNIDNSAWLVAPEISVIQMGKSNTTSGKLSDFTLTLKQRKDKTNEEDQ
jgi:type IV pilus assembly protein PilN